MSELSISQDELNRLLQAERAAKKTIKPRFSFNREKLMQNSTYTKEEIKVELDTLGVTVRQEEVDRLLGKD